MAISKITLNGVTQIDLTSDTVTASKLFDDYTAHGADGTAITGEYVAPTARTASDVTVSGATVTVPAGAYSTQVQKSVASGTAGTPTATKGTVSGHAVSVTPSVTNTTGYITGGTKTGTAVSVSASELVSGTYSVTSSGTKDVTNYASASVPSGTAGTPTATKGAVSNHSVTVTPSVTNSTGFITGSTKTGTAVTVTASELVSGSETKTANGTYDVTNLASLIVNVSGGGGASNIVHGTFTTGATRNSVGSVSVSYSGNGYPIALIAVIKGGALNNTSGGNTTWYNLISRYDIGLIVLIKSEFNTTPEFDDTTPSSDKGQRNAFYKNSTSNSTTLSTNNSANMEMFVSNNVDPYSGSGAILFKGNANTLSYYIGNNTTGTIGLTPSTEYEYYIIYSE